MDMREAVRSGETYLGIELGSTRIKAVLIGPDHVPLTSGEYDWENRYEGGYWTYHMEDVWAGLQSAYGQLARRVEDACGEKLRRVGAMGFSAMMHGYIPLNAAGELLAPFRTWRNTTTGPAASALTERFQFNIPLRWSVAHLYQAILNGEEHVRDIDYLTTLAGYVHYKLTGRKVLGVGEASGMFPIDSGCCDYDQTMMDSVNALVADKGYPWKLRDILPQVLPAGADAGSLTPEGARLLDPSGTLESGIPLAPPEGDAGTGMAATNAVAVRTGNVSAGTSVFAMIVLERPLSRVYPEIDMVTTPTGKPVAMVHCNNCTNEINAWAKVFQGFLEAMDLPVDKNKLFTTMFRSALDGEKDGGGLLLYNYLSGEPVAGMEDGRPLLARGPEGRLTFANFMRCQLFSALGALKMGMDILAKEHVVVDRLMGHGGFFKTPEAGQRIMAAAAGAPVSVMETAGEGGPWGMALLAAYRARRQENQTLEDYLDRQVFAGQKADTVRPEPEDEKGFAAFMERYVRGLPLERCAVEYLK